MEKMVKEKIKALLNLTGKRQVDIAPAFGMSKESFNNKIRSAGTRFNVNDMIQLSDITGTKLAFMDQAGNPLITFDINDID